MNDVPPVPSGVEIILDRPRRLKYGFNAMCEFEGKMGKGIAEALNEKNIGFQSARALLWAGLIWESPELTLEQAGDLIDAVPESAAEATTSDHLQYVMDRVMVAQAADQGKAKKKDRQKKESLKTIGTT